MLRFDGKFQMAFKLLVVLAPKLKNHVIWQVFFLSVSLLSALLVKYLLNSKIIQVPRNEYQIPRNKYHLFICKQVSLFTSYYKCQITSKCNKYHEIVQTVILIFIRKKLPVAFSWKIYWRKFSVVFFKDVVTQFFRRLPQYFWYTYIRKRHSREFIALKLPIITEPRFWPKSNWPSLKIIILDIFGAALCSQQKNKSQKGVKNWSQRHMKRAFREKLCMYCLFQ